MVFGAALKPPGSLLAASRAPVESSWAVLGSVKIDLAARNQENQVYDQLYGRFLASRTQNRPNRKVDCKFIKEYYIFFINLQSTLRFALFDVREAKK